MYWHVHPQVSNKGQICGYEWVDELQGYRAHVGMTFGAFFNVLKVLNNKTNIKAKMK